MLKIAFLSFFILFSAHAQLSLAPIAKTYLGVPYDSSGPLGEGELGRYDQDPLYRFDAFDCTTFVETVMALSRSSDRETFVEHLNAIRYLDGQVDYLKRNHIISLDWIPNNIRAGNVHSAMREFPSEFTASAEGYFDMGGWISFHTTERLKLPGLGKREKEQRLQELKAQAGLFTKKKANISYLIIDKILKNWDTFRESASGDYVLNIVRPNWKLSHLIGTDLHISHQGILTKETGILYFIHASASGSVKKVKLREYLKKYQGHKTVKGINLLRANI